MSKTIFFFLIWFGFIGLINDLVMIYFKRKYAKKCNYDCNNCKVWDCLSKECSKKRV